MLDMSAVENIGAVAPTNALSDLPIVAPFELMIDAITDDAADSAPPELPEFTVSEPVAPEPGP